MKTMKKTTAAIALAATAGLVAGPMVGMSQAWADDIDEDITITISEKNTDPANTGVTYSAYEIFKATVNGVNASNIEWAVDKDAQTKILQILGVTETGANSAQAAADAMVKLNIASGSELAAGSEMKQIADYMAENGTAIAFDGEAATVSETGYYLVLGTAKENTANSVATTPIFALVDADGIDITSKIDVPTVTKTVTEDSTSKEGDVANAEVGEAMTFTLSSKLPSNMDSFDSYYFKFVDQYKTAGQFAAPTDVVITVDGEPVANDAEGVKVTADANGLVVEFADISKIGKAGDAVVVTYKAALTDAAAMSTEGSNDNTVYIEYTNDPVSEGTGKTTTDDAKVYSYALQIEKTDSVTGAVIENSEATFTLVECDNEGKAIEGAKTFTAETTNGLVTVEGLDAGKYLVTETVAPNGYAKVSPFILTVTADDTMANPSFSDDSAATEIAGAKLTVKDTPNPMNLPVTGETLGLIILLVGSGIVVLSGASILYNRRKANAED